MKKMKQPAINVNDLLNSILDSNIIQLAEEVGVDYYSKVLYGRSMFYMLLTGLPESERANLHLLEDIFNRKSFKIRFQLPLDRSVKYNSISERPGTMNVKFFEKLFEEFYSELSDLYSDAEILEQKTARADSTMVSETSDKLARGMIVGRKKDGKKQYKYTICFDGLFPCSVEFFNDRKHLSEDVCIPQSVFQTAEKSKGKIFTFDRGVQKRATFDRLSQSKAEFVGRLKADSRREVVRSIETSDSRRNRSIYLISDEEVRLFGSGNKQPTEETFRLITAKTKNSEKLLFLTSIFDLLAEVTIILS